MCVRACARARVRVCMCSVHLCVSIYVTFHISGFNAFLRSNEKSLYLDFSVLKCALLQVEFFCDVLVYEYVSFITQVYTTLVRINFYTRVG